MLLWNRRGRFASRAGRGWWSAAELFFCYGKSDGGKDLEAWERKVSLGTAVAGETLSGAFEAEAGTAYRWALAASNDAGTVWSSASGGTFMTAPVSIEAPAELKEGSTAVVTFRRPAGSNLSDLPLAINCTLSGTATRGIHYNLSPGPTLTFSAGASEAVLTIESIPDWSSDNEPVSVLGLDPTSPCLPGTPSVSIPIRNSSIPAGPTNVWIGAASADATDPANWSQKRLPDAETIVLFSPQFAQNPIDWKSTMPERIAGWIQPHPFTGDGAGGNAQTYGSILDPLSHGSSGKGDSKAYAGAGIIRLTVA